MSNKSIEELFKLTPSYKYAQTIYTQSGHVIEGVAITNISAKFRSKLDGDAINKITDYNKHIFNDKSMTPNNQGFVERELIKYPGLKIDDFLPSNYHAYFILRPAN